MGDRCPTCGRAELPSATSRKQNRQNSPTHARARVENALSLRPVDPDERIAAIIEIGPGAWVRGETGPELAAAWGVSEAVIEKDAVVAWRMIRFQGADLVRGILCADLHDALQDAKENIEDASERVRARVEVAKAWGDITGATRGGNKGVQVTIEQYQDQYKAVFGLMALEMSEATYITDEQRAQLLQNIQERIAAHAEGKSGLPALEAPR